MIESWLKSKWVCLSKMPDYIPFATFEEYSPEEMKRRASEFYKAMQRRRTIREFSSRSVHGDVIENCLRAAGTAPSGANMQPWHFVVIRELEIKSRIREAAEVEEKAFYEHRAPQEWLEALEPLGTDWQKPFLERAPYLIAVFAKKYDFLPSGRKVKNYYVQESVGIATGILITALHLSGLVVLTHTPSPMGFLNEILERPKNERPYLLLVVGYPEPGAKVPDIEKKPFTDIATIY